MICAGVARFGVAIVTSTSLNYLRQGRLATLLLVVNCQVITVQDHSVEFEYFVDPGLRQMMHAGDRQVPCRHEFVKHIEDRLGFFKRTLGYLDCANIHC